jgi:hypothetical protein
LPYHIASTPSYFAPGSCAASWLPHADVVQAAERRALVARDHRPGVEAAATVGAVLVERQTHEPLQAGQEDATLLEDVLVLERDVEKRRARAATVVAGAAVAAGPAEALALRGAPPGSTALGYGDRHPVFFSSLRQPDWLS